MKQRSRIVCNVLIFAFVLSNVSCAREIHSFESAQATQITESYIEETVVETEPPLSEDEIIDQRVEEILSQMTLEDKICQMLVVSFRDGDQLNENMAQSLTGNHYGGVILFDENLTDVQQTIRYISDIQRTNQEGGGLPMFIGADQEGGLITRLSYGTSGIGNMALAATEDPQNARTMGMIYGNELRLLGINTDFAPVVDINNNPDNPVIGVRSFSDDPYTVAEYAVAFMEGLHSSGIISTLKHFPGHGNTGSDSHTGLPCIDSSYDEFLDFELIPFRAAVDAGADMIMTAHIQYPELDDTTYTSISSGEQIYLPATMSHTILTNILRDYLGFEGVVITDSLEMAAVTDNFDRADIISMSINAGADMLMLPPVYDEEGYAVLQEWSDLAVSLASDGTIDMSRIDDSVRRILRLKIRNGILDRTDFGASDAMISEAVSQIGNTEVRQESFLMAFDSLTLLKNDGNSFPIDLQAGQSVLILFADSCASRVGTGALTRQQMEQAGMIPEGAVINVMTSTESNSGECVSNATESDHVILVDRVYNSDCLDPGTYAGFSTSVFDEIISARHEAGLPVILVSCELPYDAARFPGADAILLCYGSSEMPQISPETGTGSAYAPNLQAALLSCFGIGEPGGTLPVNIPSLDGNYDTTDEILFPRGVSANVPA